MKKKGAPSVSYFMSLIMAINTTGYSAGSSRGQAVTASREKSQAGIFLSLEEAVADTERPVLLVFFSLACHVCWDELFEMKEFIDKFSIPVELIGISLDLPEELRTFVARYSFGHPVVCDRKKELYRRFKVKLEPCRVILDKNRVIYQDDDGLDFLTRREKAKQCLLAVASK